MRYREFIVEASLKSELDAQKALHDLDVINSTVTQLPPEKQSVKVTVTNKLKQMSAAIANFINRANLQQPQTQPQVQEAEGDVDIQSTIETLKEQIKIVESSNIDEKVKDQFIAPFRQQLDLLTKQVEELQVARDTAIEKQKEAENFVKEVSGYLIALGNKVQGYEEEDVTAMSAKERSLAKRRAVNAQEFTKTLKQALFGKIVDIQEEADVTPDEIKTFLAACVEGDVINMLSVIGTSRGNISQHVNPKYQKLFNIFVEQNIFSYSPGRTSGAIGPGEMALSMMGNPAEKGKKGDLKVGDQEIEIKASASSGGRLNSKSIAKATSGWEYWRRGIQNILKDAPKDRMIVITDKKGKNVKVPLNKFDGDQYNITKGKAKLGSKYNWSQKGFDALNKEVLNLYSDFDKTFELFDTTIKSLVLNIDKIKNADKLIARAIEDDGTVDWMKMNKAYTKIAYESYHLADGITTIMFLRTDTLDYTIVQDGDELVNSLGDTVITGAGFGWNDDQQTPTPGYIASKS